MTYCKGAFALLLLLGSSGAALALDNKDMTGPAADYSMSTTGDAAATWQSPVQRIRAQTNNRNIPASGYGTPNAAQNDAAQSQDSYNNAVNAANQQAAQQAQQWQAWQAELARQAAEAAAAQAAAEAAAQAAAQQAAAQAAAQQAADAAAAQQAADAAAAAQQAAAVQQAAAPAGPTCWIEGDAYVGPGCPVYTPPVMYTWCTISAGCTVSTTPPPWMQGR